MPELDFPSQGNGKDKPMKEPSPEKAGRFGLVFWAFILSLALGATAIWLWAEPRERLKWREKIADFADSWLADTPVAGVGDLFREKAPALPESLINPPTEKGTLSGREISGVIGSPVEVGNRQLSPSAINAREMIENITAAPDKVIFNQEPLPPVTEDREIKPGYLSTFADWLVARYRSGENGGTLAMSVQSLNHLFGVTLASGARGGRQGLLRYAFHPDMIRGLYNLYINRFMEDLDNAARKKGMNEAENRNFHRAIAGKATLLSNTLLGVLAMPDLRRSLAKIDDLGQKTVELNSVLSSAVADLDKLRSEKASSSQLEATQMRVDGAAARYRRAVGEYEESQRAFVSQVRRSSGSTLDEDSVLFIAAWVERRLAAGEGARAALETCLAILHDLAKRCSAVPVEQ